LGVLEIEGV